jgi:uncharacterized repeat protein (TIGR03847 family)
MGKADWIGVEALGLPGQRTFRVLAQTQDQTAQLWIEKEQLQALAEALARMLAEIDAEKGVNLNPKEQPAPAPAIPKPDNFPETTDIEVMVGALGLRYDPQRELVALEAYDRDGTENDPPSFRCLADRTQVESLYSGCVNVVSSGRPRCPFCGAPLSSQGLPHFCPPTNGHQKLTDADVE